MSYERLPRGAVNPRLIDAMVAGSQKSLLRAYLFWYFGGAIGAHNFYLGRPGLGALQAASLPVCFIVLYIAKTLDAETIAGADGATRVTWASVSRPSWRSPTKTTGAPK